MDDKELSALKALAEAVPQEKWKRDGRTVYALQHAGWRKGVEQFENRFYFGVQPGRGMSEGHAEAIAELVAAADPQAILALISRVERAERALIRGGYEDMGGEEWKPPVGKPPRFIEAPSTAVDLSGLTRYGWREAYIGDDSELIEDASGTYVRFEDVQAILATPARDVGGLMDEQINQIIAQWQRSSNSRYELCRAIEREVLATSPAPSVKQQPNDSAIRTAAQKVIDYRDGALPTRGWLPDNDRTRAALQELADALAAPSASQGEMKVPEGFALVPIKETSAMVEAYTNSLNSGFGGSPAHAAHVWGAMLTASNKGGEA